MESIIDFRTIALVGLKISTLILASFLPFKFPDIILIIYLIYNNFKHNKIYGVKNDKVICKYIGYLTPRRTGYHKIWSQSDDGNEVFSQHVISNSAMGARVLHSTDLDNDSTIFIPDSTSLF